MPPQKTQDFEHPGRCVLGRNRCAVSVAARWLDHGRAHQQCEHKSGDADHDKRHAPAEVLIAPAANRTPD
jgi:hypothetical protein